MLKLHFGWFWPPTWAQHGAKHRSKIAQNPTWPPRGRQEASKDPFWAQLELILACFGANLGPKIAHKSTSSSRTSSRWLPARWPALGAQPPVRSGHRAACSEACCRERSDIWSSIWLHFVHQSFSPSLYTFRYRPLNPLPPAQPTCRRPREFVLTSAGRAALGASKSTQEHFFSAPRASKSAPRGFQQASRS